MLSNKDESDDSFLSHFSGQSTSLICHNGNHGRLSLDSGLGNDSFISRDLNESQNLDDHSFVTGFSCSLQSTSHGEQSISDSFNSPPTKWARITTPPNRKNEASSIFSPPTGMFNSMKTPKTRRKCTGTPSPFPIIFSKTPLKLSNEENVAAYHIGRQGDIKNVNSQPMVRCISVSKRRIIKPSSADDSVCRGLSEPPLSPSVLGSPSRQFEGFEELSEATPSKINESLADERNGCWDEIGDQCYQAYNLPSTSSYSSPKSAEEEKFIHLLNPGGYKPIYGANVEKTVEILPIKQPYAETLDPIATKKIAIGARKSLKLTENKENMKVEKDVVKWLKEPFKTPTKEVPLYSGQWKVLSTGRTPAQQGLLVDAVKFLGKTRQKRGRTANIPKISRITLYKHRYGLRN